MYPMAQKPKKRLNPNMTAEAADMAAEQFQMQPEKQAPIIPTTNMRMPRMNFGGPQPQNNPQPSTPRQPGQQNVNPNDPRATRPIQPPPMNYSGGSVTAGAPVTGAVAAPKPVTTVGMTTKPGELQGVAQDTRTTDDMLEDAIAELLGNGPRSTAEEEAQIRNQMQSDVSAGQAGLNARIAAGGGGTSGALGAMSTDMRSRAALDAANAVQGVKQDARDEYLRKLQLGLSGKQSDRTLDMDEAQFEMYMNMINEIFGGSGNDSNANSIPDDKEPASYNDSGVSGSTGVFQGNTSGNTITTDTGSYQIETKKRGEDDVFRFRVSSGGKTYQVFRDANGNNYAVQV
jgi:hypothetical protein